jgi:hypothetical protein
VLLLFLIQTNDSESTTNCCTAHLHPDISVLLARGAWHHVPEEVSECVWSPTFWGSIVVSYSRVEKSKKTSWTCRPLGPRRCLETSDTIAQDSAPHPRRTETSTALLRKPKNSHFHLVWLSNSSARAQCTPGSLTFYCSVFSSRLWCIICTDCYIYGLFNDTISNSRPQGVNGGMIMEQWTQKDAEGTSHDLIWNTTPTLPTVYKINRAVNLSISSHDS